MAAGSSWAYRHIKGGQISGIEPITQDGRETVCTALTLDGQDKIWAALWDEEGKSDADYDMSQPIHTSKCRPALPPPLSGDNISACAASFRQGTSSAEGFHPRHFAGISADALLALSCCFRLFEGMGNWPACERQLLTILIPKPGGGLRPIALFRTAYRVYARCRVDRVRRWADSIQQYYFNNASGRWVGDSTWRQQVRTMIGAPGTKSIEIMLDLRKAFEFVGRRHLIEAAVAHHFPLAEHCIISVGKNNYPRRALH